VSLDDVFEEMAPGPMHDDLMVGGGERLAVTVPLCKVEGCGHTAGWTVGMYAGLCENHAAAKKAAKQNGAPKAAALPAPLPADALPTRAVLALELRDAEERATAIRELLQALDAYSTL